MSTPIKVLIGVLAFIAVICCVGGIFFYNFYQDNHVRVLENGDAIVEQTFTIYDPQFMISQMDPDAEQSHEEVKQIVLDAQSALGNVLLIESRVLSPGTASDGRILILYVAGCEFENGKADVEITYTRADLSAPLHIDRLRLTYRELYEDDVELPDGDDDVLPDDDALPEDDDALPEEHGMG